MLNEVTVEYFDIIIIGAGLSGIGAAYHLQKNCPNQSYIILEARESLGGTWDLFRYPGIRSDSDMHTLGYNFKPWLQAKAIADGESILQYIQETAQENQIEPQIRYGHRVTTARWSSQDATWTLECSTTQNTVSLSCNFLLMASGYYRYDRGYTPEFPGRERFTGQMVHPQQWSSDLDYQDRKVIVIGSGATAVTLVPELAKKAQNVVMLQRSPTYMVSRSDRDSLADWLRQWLPAKIAYALTRWKSIQLQQFFYRRTRTQPKKIRQMLLNEVRQQLDPDYDLKTHFTPSYDPWDQRLCLVPNGDLFKAINQGKVEVVTDAIKTFTETGILLQSGRELTADIIVTATGLTLQILGGIQFVVDGQPIDFAQTYTYKGLMYSGVPNLVAIFGYINASWTLRADLVAQYTCRLLNYMDDRTFSQCTPQLPVDHQMTPKPYISDFSSGYIQRSLHLLPKQGDRYPWTNVQNYQQDRKGLLRQRIDDGVLVFQ